MNEPLKPEGAIALFSKDGENWDWLDRDNEPIDWVEDRRVTKIVIGDLEAKERMDVELPEDLAALYPNLTHLHLWGIHNTRGQLPILPAGIMEVDIRNGRGFATGWPLAMTELDTLVLWDCDGLPPPRFSAALYDLSVRDSGNVSNGWVTDTINSAPSIRYFHIQDCQSLTYLTAWPELTEVINLNGCRAVRALPKQWPDRLRRLELQDTAVQALPDFGDQLDYIDLCGTQALRRLPNNWGNPRTLFLFDSGIQVPPSTELGTNREHNVADDVKGYFADVESVGWGSVQRCKLLVLGNADAGKTSLSVALTGQDHQVAKDLGSTHVPLLWQWKINAPVGGVIEDVDIQIWDFGGQEIYHNTHRLFMARASVFVVVWNPDEQPPRRSSSGYQDVHRPLQYWVDLIKDMQPRARIALVCSRRSAEADDLIEVLDEAVDTQLDRFFVDSEPRTGQLDALVDWLSREVGEVVDAEGQAVPSYWEIAQDLVQGWLQERSINQLTEEDFHQRLEQAVRQASPNYPKLHENLKDEAFSLTDDRVRRTLGFLTRSGWLYWDESLNGRVIVGQDWALKGLYAILERRDETLVYETLRSRAGVFSLKDLAELCWNDLNFEHKEQQLLLSYMRSCGLCFKLREAEQAWREEELFVSFTHLPSSSDQGFEYQFRQRVRDSENVQATLESERMHVHHWHKYLVEAGRHFGKNADYAYDGLLVSNDDGQSILVSVQLNPNTGSGGFVTIAVGGKFGDDLHTCETVPKRLEALLGALKNILPGGVQRHAKDAASLGLGQVPDQEGVFLSYTRNSEQDDGDEAQSVDYEAPVDAIERQLLDRLRRAKPGEKRLIPKRDKTGIRFGSSSRAFMRNGARQARVIVVHSDKFWRSPYCLFELDQLVRELTNEKGKDFKTVVIPIQFEWGQQKCDIKDIGDRNRVLEEWGEASSISCPAGFYESPEDMQDKAAYVVRYFSEQVSDLGDLHLHWQRGAENKHVLQKVEDRVYADDVADDSTKY